MWGGGGPKANQTSPKKRNTGSPKGAQRKSAGRLKRAKKGSAHEVAERSPKGTCREPKGPQRDVTPTPWKGSKTGDAKKKKQTQRQLCSLVLRWPEETLRTFAKRKNLGGLIFWGPKKCAASCGLQAFSMESCRKICGTVAYFFS